MKNIAIVSNTSWYIYNFRKGLLSELVSQGFCVYAIAPKDKFVEEIKAIGCTFIELKKINNKGRNPFQDIAFILELYGIFKKHSIDCSLLFTPKINIYGSIAAKFCKTKAIATINGLGFVFNEGQSDLLRYIVKGLYRFAFRGLPVVFFQNNEDKDIFIQSKIVNSEQRVCVVRGSGVNLEEFYQKTQFNSSGKLTFLLSARLIKEKGILEYFEAAKGLHEKYPEVKFALLGVKTDNPSAVPDQIIDEFSENGVIDYWGLSDAMSTTLDVVDVMVLPSYYREGIPKVLIEALAKGLPIITTDNVGCKETVDNGRNGYVIPVKDVDALARAMENIIHLSMEERLNMSNYSRNKAIAEFDERENHNAYINQIRVLTQ